MVSSGLLIKTVSDKMQQVHEALTAFTAAEITAVVDKERIVIVIQSGSLAEKNAIVRKIENIDGVAGVRSTYDHFEWGESEG